MSVVTGDRTQGKLKVLLDTAELVKYTLSVIKNEKVFPKSYRWLLSQKIADEAVDAYTCIRRANAINVKTHKDFEQRRSQQVKAYTHLEALIGLVDIAFNILPIEGKRIEHWTGLVLTAENSLKNWCRSDAKRYEELLKK